MGFNTPDMGISMSAHRSAESFFGQCRLLARCRQGVQYWFCCRFKNSPLLRRAIGDQVVWMKSSEFGNRISTARGDTKTGDTKILPHLQWELKQVMSRVRPEDLSANEIAALLAILAPAHCRVIGGPTGRPGLPPFGDASYQSPPEFA
jgi:hypothetical protein